MMETERERHGGAAEGGIECGFVGCRKNGKRETEREERGQKGGSVCKLFGDGTDTHVAHQQGIKKQGETGVVEALSSLSVFVPGYCLLTAMADI